MNERSFDAATRQFTRNLPRRTALGAALSALLLLYPSPIAAACKKVGQTCDKNKDCCAGETCKGKKCKCKSGWSECDGKCFKLDSDENHCGDCTIACASDETCCAGICADLAADGENCGACGVVCAPGETCCDGGCADLTRDRGNCGACGVQCDVLETCQGGVCQRKVVEKCAGGLTRCDDECVDLQGDRHYCGACDVACAPGTRCCGGACVDVDTDVNNCGACGNACDEHAHCCSGTCSFLDDLENCWACGHFCPAGADRCIEGWCCFPGELHPRSPDCGDVGCCHTEPLRRCGACNAQESCCGDLCVALESDRANCGRCSRACDNTSICDNGTCLPCPPGRVVCGNQCCFP